MAESCSRGRVRVTRGRREQSMPPQSPPLAHHCRILLDRHVAAASRGVQVASSLLGECDACLIGHSARVACTHVDTWQSVWVLEMAGGRCGSAKHGWNVLCTACSMNWLGACVCQPASMGPGGAVAERLRWATPSSALSTCSRRLAHGWLVGAFCIATMACVTSSSWGWQTASHEGTPRQWSCSTAGC